ncbi:MAG TPA: glycosyl hydrolase [Acidobacteriaceae bacterium]|jgi:hypothetical protein|nr:glycosyl hydrolase [Acidobacteriaceae bacterium]
MKRHQRTHLALAACTLLLTFPTLAQTPQPTLTQLRATFAAPPPDARPIVRWWWFGPAVAKPELARELNVMHAAGIGGVELAAEYPLALDDPQKGILNLRYASPQYIDMVHFAADHARALGMRVDLTLGSGWPYGGPNVPLALSAGRLRIVAVPLSSSNTNAAPPQPAEGDHFLAAFLADGTLQHYDAATAHQLPGTTFPTSLAHASAHGTQVELFFIAGHTRQQVKRAAFGGEGFVLDHLSKPAVDHYLQTTGDTLLSAFPTRPPYAIFSDSLEVYASDWTPDLPAEFQRLRGYNLIPHLPELAQGGTPEADSVRRDWGETLSDLMRDIYLRTMADYAVAHHTLFRSQTYGEPAVTLFDEHIPQLPEGEGPQWHAFAFTRWASSANHVFGNNITSAETFTWLHSPAFRATPLDMKAEADRMFLEGVNQIVCHGFPYSAPGVAEPGWSLYAAAALNDHNPWWPVMPYVMKYLQRVSWALRQGQPANDVALLLPEADAQAAFRPGHVSVTDEMHLLITPDLMGAILDTGYNLDYIDVPSIQFIKARGLHYPIVVVPPTQRMPLAGVHALEAYVAHGGKLIFLGETPSLTAGLADAADTPAVAQGIQSLLARSTHVDTTAELAAALPKLLAPDIALGAAGGKVGFLHRRLPDADIYFFANTTPDSITLPLHLRNPRPHAEWWDPDSGQSTAADLNQPLTLPPYGSRLLLLSSSTSEPAKLHTETTSEPLKLTTFAVDKIDDWTVTFPGSKGSPAFPTQHHVHDTLWTNSPATRFYSGEVIYSTSFTPNPLHPGERAVLHFTPGKPLPDTQPPHASGMRAWFDPPLREAALIYLNGKEIGALWHPPYRLDLTPKPGRNTLEIHIFNTAINELAGQPPRDYTALQAKYGNRFQMQDMQNLQPIPSGIEGPVEIEYVSVPEAP